MKYVNGSTDFECPPPKRARRMTSGGHQAMKVPSCGEQWLQANPGCMERTGAAKETQDFLPYDPRDWARCDVRNWLVSMARVHSIPDLHLERFLMNGKALCLMSLEMYLNRVPLGGKLLYRDFQIRLGKAMYAAQEKENNSPQENSILS